MPPENDDSPSPGGGGSFLEAYQKTKQGMVDQGVEFTDEDFIPDDEFATSPPQNEPSQTPEPSEQPEDEEPEEEPEKSPEGSKQEESEPEPEEKTEPSTEKEATINALEDEISTLVQEKQEIEQEHQNLQAQINWYLNDPQGQRQLVQHLRQQGVLGQSTQESTTQQESDSKQEKLEKAFKELSQYIPSESLEPIKDAIFEMRNGQAKTTSQNGQPRQNGQNQQNGQANPQQVQAQQELNQAVQNFQETNDPKHWQKVNQQIPGADMTWMDYAVKQNPGKFLDMNGVPKRDKLGEIYAEACKAANLEPDIEGGSGDPGGNLTVEERIERAKEQGRKEYQEQLEKNKQTQSMSPSGNTGEDQVKLPENPTMQEAWAAGKEEHNISFT